MLRIRLLTPCFRISMWPPEVILHLTGSLEVEKYYSKEKSMHRSTRFRSHKYVSPHWIILPPATEHTQLNWMHMKPLKSWRNDCFSMWFEVLQSGGREGVKPQRDAVIFLSSQLWKCSLSGWFWAFTSCGKNLPTCKTLPLCVFHLFLQQHPLLANTAWVMFLWLCLGNSKHLVEVRKSLWSWLSVDADLKHKTGRVGFFSV